MTRVGRGIYKDTYRYDVRVTVNGITRYKSYALDTDMKTMRGWQDTERAAIRRAHPTLAKGTLAADVARYLALPKVAKAPSCRVKTLILTWWADRLGHKRRHQITAQDIKDGMQEVPGTAPGYQDQYRKYLLGLWREFDGKQAYCPAREVDALRSKEGPVRALSAEALNAVLDSLPQPESPRTARIRVLAATGMPPRMLRQIRPEDVDLIHRTVTMPARQKGAGVAGRVLPLTDEGVAAFKVWLEVGAAGEFSVAKESSWFRYHCGTHGVPCVGIYRLRHTFATRVLVNTNGSLEAVQGLLMHASMSTTQRYTRGAVPILLRSAVDAMNAQTAPQKSLAEQSSSSPVSLEKTVH